MTDGIPLIHADDRIGASGMQPKSPFAPPPPTIVPPSDGIGLQAAAGRKSFKASWLPSCGMKWCRVIVSLTPLDREVVRMLRFAEEIMLLLLDDKGGRFVAARSVSLEYALAGAVLGDNALEGRIDTDTERLFMIDPAPLEDDLLDPTLARIAQSVETHDPGHWINQTATHAGDIQERSLARLVERGILRREDDRFMWVFHERRYPMIDNKAVQEVKLRIMGVLFSDEIPDARDIVIISLADACGIFGGILCGRELAGAAQRIAQVRKMDLIGREVSKAVRDIELYLATAMVWMR